MENAKLYSLLIEAAKQLRQHAVDYHHVTNPLFINELELAAQRIKPKPTVNYRQLSSIWPGQLLWCKKRNSEEHFAVEVRGINSDNTITIMELWTLSLMTVTGNDLFEKIISNQ